MRRRSVLKSWALRLTLLSPARKRPTTGGASWVNDRLTCRCVAGEAVLLICRQRDRKCRTPADSAGYLDVPPHGFNKILRDEQTQPGAFTRLFGGEITVEDPVDRFGRYPRAVVGNS